jgi:hypothetical protein
MYLILKHLVPSCLRGEAHYSSKNGCVLEQKRINMKQKGIKREKRDTLVQIWKKIAFFLSFSSHKTRVTSNELHLWLLLNAYRIERIRFSIEKQSFFVFNTDFLLYNDLMFKANHFGGNLAGFFV